MDENPTDLRAALRELADEESGAAGPHVEVERLIAYRQGTLPAAEREAVQEHLSLCPHCTGLLLELRDFEATAARGEAGPESLRQEAWDSLIRRLPAAAPAVRPITSAGRHAEPRRRSARFAMGLAAALLLAVLGVTVWTAVTALRERQQRTRLEQQLEERDAALAALQSSLAEAKRQLDAAHGQIRELSKERIDRLPEREKELEARVAELSAELEELRRSMPAQGGRDRLARAEIDVSVAPRFAVRGQEAPGTGFLRGGGVANSVRKPPQGDRFIVALSLADHSIYKEYRLELLDRDGQVLWSGRQPGSSLLGDAGTSVSIEGLGPGRYRLRIEGLHPDRSELLAEYLLKVEP